MSTLKILNKEYLTQQSDLLEGLIAGVKYRAYIVGKDTYLNKKFSNLPLGYIEFTMIENYINDTPVLNFIDKTDTTIDLSWSIDNNWGATNYKLYEIGDAINPIYDGTDLSYQVTGLAPSTPYTFYVVASRDSGATLSNESNPIAKTTNPAVSPPLTTPTLIIVDTTPSTINFIATLPVANIDELLRITDWGVQYRVKGSSNWINASFPHTGNQMSIAGLSADTVYELRILSNDSVNTVSSSYSAIVEAITLEEVILTGAIIDVTTNNPPVAEGYIQIYDAVPNSIAAVEVTVSFGSFEGVGSINFDNLAITVFTFAKKTINLNIDSNGRSILSDGHFIIDDTVGGTGNSYTIKAEITGISGGILIGTDSATYTVFNPY